jgi:hypothetical protein
MGYTHYFQNKGHKDDQQNFLKVLAEAKKLYKNLPEHSESAGGFFIDQQINICGPLGNGEPIFDERSISFNGDELYGMEHETFHVTPTVFSYFCKTVRKPYDLLVSAVLLSMKRHMKNFSFTSDGKPDDWKPAEEFYEKVCGKQINLDKDGQV